MANPRGQSVYERYAYEATLLKHLKAELPNDPWITRIKAYEESANTICDWRCERAAKEILRMSGYGSQFILEVQNSVRGRNHFDYILHNIISDVPVLLEVKVVKTGTGADYAEMRLPYYKLLRLLRTAVFDEYGILYEKYDTLLQLLDDNRNVNWTDLPDRSLIYYPAKELLSELAQQLWRNGSSLLGCLWGYYYRLPVLRVTFAQKRTLIQSINPFRIVLKNRTLLDTTASVGICEKTDAGTVKVRIHTSKKTVSMSSLMAGITFQMPDDLYPCTVIHDGLL